MTEMGAFYAIISQNSPSISDFPCCTIHTKTCDTFFRNFNYFPSEKIDCNLSNGTYITPSALSTLETALSAGVNDWKYSWILRWSLGRGRCGKVVETGVEVRCIDRTLVIKVPRPRYTRIKIEFPTYQLPPSKGCNRGTESSQGRRPMSPITS